MSLIWRVGEFERNTRQEETGFEMPLVHHNHDVWSQAVRRVQGCEQVLVVPRMALMSLCSRSGQGFAAGIRLARARY